MTEASIPTLRLYFPLWGAIFDSDGVGGIGQGVRLYVPDVEEWLVIQKTDVWMAQFRSEPGQVEGPIPPCCIVLQTSLGNADSIHAAVEDNGEKLLSMACTAVTALRLFRSGWFLQPEQAMYVFYAPSLPLNILRFPGLYRQVFVSDPTDAPMARFELKMDDLTSRFESPGPIAATWEVLQGYRRSGSNASVEIAIESFNRSYGFQLRPVSRTGNLFTALDAMLGGMSAWKVGNVPVKPRGYARRVEVALRSSASPAFPDDPQDAARWLHSRRGARGLRNAIAHGTGSAVESEAERAFDRLQAIVRSLLWQYLHFATIWARRDKEIAARLHLVPESPLTAAYVTALEAEAKRPGSMLDLLRGSHVA